MEHQINSKDKEDSPPEFVQDEISCQSCQRKFPITSILKHINGGVEPCKSKYADADLQHLKELSKEAQRKKKNERERSNYDAEKRAEKHRIWYDPQKSESRYDPAKYRAQYDPLKRKEKYEKKKKEKKPLEELKAGKADREAKHGEALRDNEVHPYIT